MQSSLKQHMTVNDGDHGYIARLKAASLANLKEAHASHVTGINKQQIATALDPHYKML
jgi:hypothetical protein